MRDGASIFNVENMIELLRMIAYKKDRSVKY
jgi:hypothetical protein